MATLITWVHCLTCILLVAVVLVQSGKGAEISASLGGSSQTVFGSSGGANFFSTFTGICAALFMFTSVFLATQGGSRVMGKSVMDVAVPATTAPQAKPATGAENAVVPPKPETQAHAPDQATKNAIMPGAANPPAKSAPNSTAPQQQ